jgi:hypothetical protein
MRLTPPESSLTGTRCSHNTNHHFFYTATTQKFGKKRNQPDPASQQPEQGHNSNMHGNSPAHHGFDEGYAIAYWAEERGYSVWWLLLVVVGRGVPAGSIMESHSG